MLRPAVVVLVSLAAATAAAQPAPVPVPAPAPVPVAAPAPVPVAAPAPVAAPLSTYYVGLSLDASAGDLVRLGIGADLGLRAARSNAWYRFRVAGSGWAHLDGGAGSIVEGMVGIEGRSPRRGAAAFAGIDGGIAHLTRDGADEFDEEVSSRSAFGVSIRPRVGVDFGAGSTRFRLGGSLPFIYVADEIALALMVSIGFVAEL